MIVLASSALFANLGSILQGISALLLAVGAGVGFVVRSRRTAQRERLRTEAAATLAAQEAKKALETRLEIQHAAQIATLESQITELRTLHSVQIEQFKDQIEDLQHDREQLLARILREYGDRDDH